jgi:hypothetical protein
MNDYLEYPLVIDWLQWHDFKFPMGGLDYPQITLTMIAEMREDIKKLEVELAYFKNGTQIKEIHYNEGSN